MINNLTFNSNNSFHLKIRIFSLRTRINKIIVHFFLIYQIYLKSIFYCIASSSIKPIQDCVIPLVSGLKSFINIGTHKLYNANEYGKLNLDNFFCSPKNF